MAKIFLPLFTFVSFSLYLLFPAGCRAGESGFRLIYIGSLSGYVKLCG
ncbi:MAG: hypothetical protein U9Q39_06390 [Pseudomonadota bacterium]|nr:hypothetical protein [Pseudomonadota bacterium]